ncbi:LysR family transcriptional regulator [Alphaproteobacteria bacterium GH1-50]|uniref:LysR family transcriptional regulator n=1 Tax=Kangsaoukella pontilimi TaxID=2691042 RepID=A0A7C9J271_9RHOB|nr:LysR substrate-binding domain-containing protein [Kangsaoukella pontilimi]MXQ07381.1 LysR family transcriptional regulator [Kangsaoukella pontilimi]
MHLPSTAVLRSFEAAARFESFTAAAEMLGISQAVVGRQVREFEDLVGTALFRKEGRGVVLTPAGETLARDLHRHLDDLRRSLIHAQTAGATGQSLRVAILPTFGSHWIAPRLKSFKKLRPEARFLFESRTAPFDLTASGVDVAIHFGAPDWVGGRLTRLCPENLVAVAAPDLLDASGFTTAEDCAGLPLLHLSSRASLWQRHFSALGLETRLALAGDHFDQFSTMIAAARHGSGAAIVPSYLIENDLSSGALLTIGTTPQGTGSYYAVRPLGVQNALAAAFCDWLRTETQVSRQRHGGNQTGVV